LERNLDLPDSRGALERGVCLHTSYFDDWPFVHPNQIMMFSGVSVAD
jgi:hypothetical protein